MPITSGDFRRYDIPSMIKEINTNTDRVLSSGQWKEVVEQGTLETDYSETFLPEASGAAKLMFEGQAAPEIRIEEGYSKRRALSDYGCCGAFTRRVLETGNKKKVKRIKDAVMNSPEQLFDNIAYSGYMELGDTAMTSIPTINGVPIIDSEAADGRPIFDTAHTFHSDIVNTYPTKSTGYLTLNQTNLFASIYAVQGWKNNVGNNLEADVKMMQIPIAWGEKAYELLHSRTKSETANRADNAINNYLASSDYKVLRKIVNQTEWFLKTTFPNDLMFEFAMKPRTYTKDDELIGVHWIIMAIMFAHGCADPRGMYAIKA